MGDQVGLLVEPLRALRAAVLSVGVVSDRVSRELARDLEPLVADGALVVTQLLDELAVRVCLLVPNCVGSGRRERRAEV